MWRSLILGSVLVMLLGACASLSEAECRTGDWYGIGERDGRDGEPDRLGDHAQACRKAGIIPDAAQYFAGRTRGLTAYCTPANGYREGRAGHGYDNVCPPELSESFVRQYNYGRERYELGQEVARLESRLRSRINDIARLDDLIVKSEKEEDRKRFRRERDDLRRGMRDLEYELDMARARRDAFVDAPMPY